MANRFNVYLDDESEAMFNHIESAINHERRQVVMEMKQNQAVNLSKYKPIGKSELIQQMIKKSFRDDRKILLQELEELNKLCEIKEEKLKQLNKGLWNKELKEGVVKC